MSYKVITHNGKAHMDELMAISLLAYIKDELPEEITRVHPDEAIKMVETKDDSTYFIDCGMDFRPELHLFDHHHSAKLSCSALLIFEYYFGHLIDSSLHEYVKLVSLVDTGGPKSLGDFTFKSDSIYYFSFTQKLLLKEFEEKPLQIVSIFVDGLTKVINFEEEKEKGLEWIKGENNISVDHFGALNILKYNAPPPLEIASAVKAVDGDIIDEFNIDVVYSYDKDNTEVRTLFRTIKGHDSVDFTKAKVKNTQFCHPGGFLLKFIPKDTTEWLEILKESKITIRE